MDPITPVIERCKKRLLEVREILAAWDYFDDKTDNSDYRSQLQREEKDLVTIIQALRFTRTLNFPGGPEE